MSDSKYFLPGDNAEGDRLDLQHWVLKHGFYRGQELVFAPLELSIPPDGTGSKYQILDAACGTGVWAIELANKYPDTTRYTLADYNTGPCKHRNPQLPRNVGLQQYDLLKDFDKHPDWSGRFHLIHQRLLIFALPPAQWQTVLKGYFDSQRPGGYIQLEEYETFAGQMSEHYETLKQCIASVSHPRGIHSENLARDVEQSLKEAGFEDIQIDRAFLPYSLTVPHEPVPDGMLTWWRVTLNAVAGPALKLGMISQEGYDRMLAGLMHAIKNPEPHFRLPMVSFVARKPLQEIRGP